MKRSMRAPLLGRGRTPVLVAAAAMVMAIPWSPSPAGAVVGNAGAVSVALAGSLTMTTGLGPIVIGPITGTAVGTVGVAGNLSFPQASISFAPLLLVPVGPIVANVTLNASAAWTGTIDPDSGALTLVAPATSHLDLSISGLPDTDCPLGLPLALTSGASGAVTGVPYNKTTVATVVDGTFVVPAIDQAPPPPGCPDAGLIDALGGRPLASGASVLVLTATFTPILRGDITPPSCALTGVIAGPPKQLQITVQDSDGGLRSIAATTANNANVAIPAFIVGTTSPVVVTVTTVDQSKPAQVGLKVTDVAGNVTNCDRILTTTVRGQDPIQTFTGVPQTEHTVVITNGTPGLRSLEVAVNGHHLWVFLSDGASRSLDISWAMQIGSSNTITLQGHGPRNSSANVIILD